MTNTANKFDYSGTRIEATTLVMVREMSISMERFAKRLPHAAKGVVSEDNIASGHFKLKNADGSVAISCEKMANRYVGLLTIPVTKIELDFSQYDANQIASFMRGFDRAYLELGG